MKKTIYLFLLLLSITGQLLAQHDVFRVQGIPRPDIQGKSLQNRMQVRTATTDDVYDYSTFSLDSIKFWVGTGANRAALLIDWYDGKGSQTAMVWGFRWATGTNPTGYDMIKAIAKADKRFMFLTHSTGPTGNTIAGLGYDRNNSGNPYLIYNNDTKNPHYPVDGMVVTTAYDYDSWKNGDAEDHFSAGWYSGYWSYQVKDAGDADFNYSGLGASSRILQNGSCDAWGYQDFNSSGSQSGVLPRMPFVYVTSPYSPLPDYTSYWSEMGKDSTHLSVTDARTPRKAKHISEKWKVQLSSSWISGAQPIVVNGNVYLAVNDKIKIIDKETGAIIKENTLAGSCGFFSMIAYGEGKIFVPLGDGVLQAFNAETLESLWVTEAKSGYQQICPVVYYDGYVYTGMWRGGSPATGTYYCVSAQDEDPYAPKEIKSPVWESTNVGFYWSGGTVVGNAIVFGGDDGILQSRNRRTGVLIDSMRVAPELSESTIRSGVSYDKTTGRLYFTGKESNKIMGVKFNFDGTFDKSTFVSGVISGQVTTVPVAYNGRVYVTSGTMTSNGGLDVMDALTLQKIYSVNIGGISQATPLLSTAYANESNKNTVYIYVTLNNKNGSIVCIKDFEGNTEPTIQYTYNASSPQYCTHSLVANADGTLYYKNDAKYLFALASLPIEDVASVSLNATTEKMYLGDSKKFTATVLPENATDKSVVWTSLNPQVAAIDRNGVVKTIAAGEAKIVVTTQDGAYSDTCTIAVEKMLYNEGVFFINEDWFGHNNGTVNFLDSKGNWHYRVYQRENPGKELGSTSQYGAIYGDKFFIVSKQANDGGSSITGSRLAVCNAETMESLAEFAKIGDGDGRSFLGVDQHKGYIGTSNGIYLFDMDKLAVGTKIKGSENGTGSLYSGQIGTMLRVGERAFAVNQQKGVMVINVEKDSVETIIAAPVDGTKKRGFGSIVQSKDGNLWLSVASNTSGSGAGEEYMLRMNPYTMDTVRVQLPTGASIPNSWYAWTADGFCSSTQNNKIYWKNNAGWFNSTKIYEYDIDKNATRVLVDLSTYKPGENWGIYGAGFRLDPRTDDIYVSLYKSFGDQSYTVVKVDSENGTVTGEYPMEDNYWFPAMPVFTDSYAPVVKEALADISIVNETRIYLGDKVTDDDNIDAAIVKSIATLSHNDIVKAFIRNDSLIIVPDTDRTGAASLTLRFNSNGKVVTKPITVTVTSRPSGLNGVADDDLRIYPTLTTGQITIVQQAAHNARLFDAAGRLLQEFSLREGENKVDITPYPGGIYFVKVGDQIVKVIKE